MIPVDRAERILDLGCGTGVLTAELSRRWPAAEITAIDGAPGMVEAMKRKLPRVHSYVADISCLARNPVFDLVTSNCALHWVAPFTIGIRCVADQTRPRGVTAISLMLDGTLRELHEIRREIAPQKIPAGRMPAFEDVAAALGSAGFESVDATAQMTTVIFPSPKEFFSSLRAQGLTAGHLARSVLPLTRSEIVRLEATYGERFATAGGVVASYRIGYFVAVKHP